MWNPNAGGQRLPYGAACWPSREGIPTNAAMNLQQHYALAEQMAMHGMPQHATGIPQMGGWALVNPAMQQSMMQQGLLPVMRQQFTPMTLQAPYTHLEGTQIEHPHACAPTQQAHQYGTNIGTTMHAQGGGMQTEQAHGSNAVPQYGSNMGIPHTPGIDVSQAGNQVSGIQMEQPSGSSQPIHLYGSNVGMPTRNNTGPMHQEPPPPGVNPHGMTDNFTTVPMQLDASQHACTQAGSNPAALLPQGHPQFHPQARGRESFAAGSPNMPISSSLPDISNDVSRQFDNIISGNKPISRVVVDVACAKEKAEHLASFRAAENVSGERQKPSSPSKSYHKRPIAKYLSPSRNLHSPRTSSPSPNRSRHSDSSSSGIRSSHRSRADTRKDTECRAKRHRSSHSPSPYRRRADINRGRGFHSPSDSCSRTRDHNDEDFDSDRDSQHLRCCSPPPPDSTRKVKFIMPEEFYNRVKKGMVSDSTITGTQKLSQLYGKFEETLLNAKDSGPNMEEHTPQPPQGDIGEEAGDLHGSDLESIPGSEFSGTRTNDGVFSDNEFAASDVSVDSDVELGDMSDSSDDEGCHANGPSPEEVKERKIKDPRRLHRELWFNEKGETNEGPVCRCSAKDKQSGIRHAVYPGEKELPLCDPLGNNANKLHHYWITVTPHANFMTDRPSIIRHNGRDFVFEGFSMFSHQPLEKVPPCTVIRFNIEYTIHFVEQPAPKNFCVRGLDLFSRFLFSNILELFDWVLKDEDKDECQRFHFMPRFIYQRKEQEKGFDVHELLSMDKVLSHLMDSNKPLIQPSDLDVDASKRQEFSKTFRNQIVRKPGKKPSAFRVDDLDFSSSVNTFNSTSYPYIVHNGIRPVQMSYAGNPKYQKLWKSFIKLRNALANRSVSSRKDHDKLIQLKIELQKMKLKSSMRRDFQVKLDSRGLMKTGIHSDICQHAMLLPVLVHHVRYHVCLGRLDDKLGYTFKDRMLLQLALTHPSYHLNYGMNPDHARNSLSNCGVKQPRYGDRRIHHIHSRKKGVTHLIRVMANLAKVEENNSMIRHNERLEFLGDAVLEFICSKHLFFMLPDKSEGHLATFRSALVQNRHLALLAKKLGLSDYMQFAHGPDLCVDEDLNHAMANCLEALLGAVYLEAGLHVATQLFSRLAFSEEDLYDTWTKLPKHQLQTQEPDGDRHLIDSSPVLQKLVQFEEASGIPFTHIRVLARAFTHPQVGYNNLTLGDNQRLEFLGDSVLQFVVSVYLYRYFPEHHEGHLTLLRSSLVNSRTQAEVARQLKLEEFMNFGAKGIKNIKEKMLADVLEAFIAALFVDKGLRHVEVFCRVCFFSRLEDNIVNQEWMDAKSQLQQCCLAMRTEGKKPDLPAYKVLQNAGPAHHKTFIVGVYYKGKRYGKGEGQSIQQAEMAAAKDALSSNYFPEMARQRHVLDRKHKDKRATHRSRSPRREAEPRKSAENPGRVTNNPRTGSESPRGTSGNCRRVSESPRGRSQNPRGPEHSRRSKSRVAEDNDLDWLDDPDDSWVDIDVSEIRSAKATRVTEEERLNEASQQQSQ